ncbi:ATP-grasp domain-containing protein [Dactylosporangium sp. AC04546]|uniref:ATP-grasp domain-containing protein n=1 Tax=Dactylosporangium sp. AC04546 TaxID=2862460 RepID=UPI001EDFB6F3|nr:ATP-grasp domain-containing protein [Dactylosporangium sp. AC04546]WVK78307.1 ATP-grasp domain-containing protein [Dactylosporangium sp. AC04546]
MMLLVPVDPVVPRRVDAHFANEAAAARAAGVAVALVDHDALAGRGDAGRAVERVPGGATAVYRGWMLGSDRYAAFAAALAERGTTLRTPPEAYRRGHELPGWYDTLEGLTPESAWTSGPPTRAAFDTARRAIGDGPAVLRDYSKSLKHYWHEAAYIPDVADADAAWAVGERFAQLRGDEFTGGFVLRRFEPFTGAEVRTWWVGGRCRLVTAHPDTPEQLPPGDLELPPGLAGAVTGLPFVTVDLARRADGAWRVVELGDGQVSDRPASTPPEQLLTAVLDG